MTTSILYFGILAGAVSSQIFLAAAAESGQGLNSSDWVYVGTYTGAKSKGIYRMAFDRRTGQLESRGVAAETPSPSFLAVDPRNRFLYAVNEVSGAGGKKTGAVSAFSMDRQSGALTFLNQTGSGGEGPCHLVVDASGKNVIVANYGSGSTAVIRIEKDGRLGEMSAMVQHRGTSSNPQRQNGPHAHCVTVDDAHHFVLVNDLGLDEILVYRFDAGKGTLEPNQPPYVALASGSGPRHFAFHPKRRYGYDINELNSTLTALEYDSKAGSLKEIQTISTLPAGFSGNNSTAEVRVHPNGKFVYGSNRGHNSIAVFAIDPASGQVRLIQHQSTGGKVPRGFAIDPSGRFLLAANQDSDNVVEFRIDAKTGLLSETGTQVQVGMPVDVLFVPVGKQMRR